MLAVAAEHGDEQACSRFGVKRTQLAAWRAVVTREARVANGAVAPIRVRAKAEPRIKLDEAAFAKPLKGMAVADQVTIGPGSQQAATLRTTEQAPLPRIEVVEEVITQVEEHRLKRKLSDAQADVKRLTAELSDAQAMGDVIREAQANPVDPIIPREHSSGLREGTALVMASDWHIEEEVIPASVAFRNKYNLEISAQRMARFFSATRWAADFSRQAFEIRDMVLWLGGDFISNFIHQDLTICNLMTPPQALAYAQASIVAGIKSLLEDPKLERLVVPCNDGNHGRMTQKMGSASRTSMSLETLLYGMIAREFAGDPRVEFIIAEGEHLYYEVYGRTIRFVHGDSVRYNGGVGGLTIPLYKAVARWDTLRKSALTCVAHHHTRICLPDIMVNSSLIGYGPFSMTIGARYEPPSQNFSILDPLRFRSLDLPLWVADREDDCDA